MNKIIWFWVDWRDSFPKVLSRIREAQYSESEATGFILQKARDDEIAGKFVEKRTFDYQSVDPYEKSISFQTTRYDYVQFRLSPTRFGLEILNPPKSIKTFLSRLALLSDFHLSVSNLQVDTLRWIESMRPYFPHFEFRALVCDNILLGPHTRGRLTLAGTDDLFEIAKTYKPEKWREISFSFRHPELGQGVCTIMDTGACKVKCDRNPEGVHKIAFETIPMDVLAK